MHNENVTNNGLTHSQKKIIKEILHPFANQIDLVGLFGSRATGLYRNNSDVDIVIYGSLQEEDINHLWTLFDGSLLPIKVDLTVYSRITYSPLKEHIDREMKPLFRKDELFDETPSSCCHLTDNKLKF